MTKTPFMPKATAVWLVENTTLTFRQIAEFCNLHELEIKGIADGDVAKGIKAYNPILAGQLSRDEIEKCSNNPQEKLELLKDLGLTETTLKKVINAGYSILDLITYFTCGPKETRAWTIIKQTTAPKAAGKIHTDFEKGFIRAETVSYEDFVQNDGWVNSKTNGKMRLEGKDYIVKDGDVLNFRFNT